MGKSFTSPVKKKKKNDPTQTTQPITEVIVEKSITKVVLVSPVLYGTG